MNKQLKNGNNFTKDDLGGLYMRREGRQKNTDSGFRNLIMWSGGVLLVAIIAFVITFAVYSNKVKEDSRVSTLNSGKVSELVPSLQTEESDTSVSTSIGKTVEQMQNVIANSIGNQTSTEETNTQSDTNNETASANTQTNSSSNDSNTSENTNTNTNTNTQNEVENSVNQNTDTEKETKKELSFKMPVEGEIVKEFAKDNLLFSETLQEWMTHLGIDIKAEKTTVVKSAEAGTIKSIKNDPRYGLTVVIEHQDGYKSVYSNLLTAEFVSEGEKVEQGQTIGTVGTTAIFEVADEPHLHFEILKDNEYVDPSILLSQ